MKRKWVLIVSSHKEAIETAKQDFEIDMTNNQEKAIEYMHRSMYNAILINQDWPIHETNSLKKIGSLQQPSAPIEMYTPGSDLIATIKETLLLNSNERPAISIIDNAFQNASLQINEQ